MPVQGKININGKNSTGKSIKYTIYDDSMTSEYTNTSRSGSTFNEDILLAPGTHYILMEKDDESAMGPYNFILDYMMNVPTVTAKNLTESIYF